MGQYQQPRIVAVDGISGSGKTTLIYGTSARSVGGLIRPNLNELAGYTCFPELQTKARQELAKQGISQNDDGWKCGFLEMLLVLEDKERIPQLSSMASDQIAVLDKSHYPIIALAEELGVSLPDKFKIFYGNIRYDAIFLCKPVPSFIEGRGISIDKANAKYQRLNKMYQQEGYVPIELPIIDGSLTETAAKRVDIFKKCVK